MFKINLILTFLLISLGLSAQFVNNGATVTIQSGATLRVETDIQNNGTGTITNNGTIEVSGNFTNAATAILTPSVGLVKFVTATGSPANATLDAGGDALNNVEMAKTSNHTVTLTSPASMGGNLSFTGAGSKILLGVHDLTMTNAAGTVTATTDHPTNGYVVTNGTGKFVKVFGSNSTFNFPIGDDINDYTPISVQFTGSGYSSSSSIKASVIDLTHPNVNIPATSTSYLSRYWDVDVLNITSIHSNFTATYIASDVVGTESQIAGASYEGTAWNFNNSSINTVNKTVSVTSLNNNPDISGKNKDINLNAKVFLSNVSGGTMGNYLGTNGLVPLNDPYTTVPYAGSYFSFVPSGQMATTTQAIINSNSVIDWVFVELRTGSVGATTVVASKSGLLKGDGTIINPDGTAFSFAGITASSYFVAIKHRNHCGFMTNAATALPNASLLDFTNGSLTLYEPNHAALKDIGGGVFAMWTGDSTIDQSVDGGDLNTVRSFSGNIVDEYHRADVNLDGQVDGADVNLTRFNSGLVGWQID